MQKNLALQHRCGMFDKATTLLFNLSDQRPVSKISLVSFISHLPRLVSIDPSHYSGHSFRIEGATSASLAGLTDYEIKLLGRWNSDFYQRYTRSPFSCSSVYPARSHKRTLWSFSTPLLINFPFGLDFGQLNSYNFSQHFFGTWKLHKIGRNWKVNITHATSI